MDCIDALDLCGGFRTIISILLSVGLLVVSGPTGVSSFWIEKSSRPILLLVISPTIFIGDFIGYESENIVERLCCWRWFMRLLFV